MILRELGLVDYATTFAQMQTFVAQRNSHTADEFWFCQHPAVFTQGRAGKAEYLGNLGEIPLVQTDRGGQVTYHGPGQLVLYPLVDLHHFGLGVKAFVHLLEQSVIDLLADAAINAQRLDGAPGLYVAGQKIASLGLRIKHGYVYHGVSLNVAMDLSPFERIVPCGLPQMTMTQWQDHAKVPQWPQIHQAWWQKLTFLLENAHDATA